MELELEACGAGSRTNRVVLLSGNAETAELGRGDLGPAEAPPADHTVSRRHVSLRFLGGGDHKVAFEVVGRNPVVVRSADGNMVYRRAEAGELRARDGLSLKAPSFWAMRRTNKDGEGDMDAAVLDAVARRERRGASCRWLLDELGEKDAVLWNKHTVTLSKAKEWGEAIGVFRVAGAGVAAVAWWVPLGG